MARGQERVDQADRLRSEIGWSWQAFIARFGYSPSEVARIRSLRLDIPDQVMDYLKRVAEAVNEIPVPDIKSLKEADDMVENGLRAAGARPAEEAPRATNIPVMMLDTIAEKLTQAYRDFALNAELSEDERRGAQWSVGQIVDIFGVRDQVRALLRPASPRVEGLVQGRRETWQIPQPPEQSPLRVPFAVDVGTGQV